MTQARRILSRLAGLKSEKGFTLIEVLVAGVVLVIGFIFISQFFTSATSQIMTSDTRSLMQQIANQEIETIRALQYQDVGTVNGNPAGALYSLGENANHDPRVVEGRSFLIVREVTYIRDPSYSASEPYPANYRRATVKVYLVGKSEFDPLVSGVRVSSIVQPVAMSTNVAGGAKGGTIDITVSDVSGIGVKDAQLTISNNTLSPHVLINASAIRTDDLGKMMVPGLTADSSGGYQVHAEKSGYDSAELKQTVVVVDGLPFTVVQLIIDRVATMNVHVTDQAGAPMPGVALKVTGYKSVSPFTFSQNVTTDTDGAVTLPNIRYSTSLEPYFIELVTAHNPPLRLPTGVDPPNIDTSFLPLAPGKVPVLLDPGDTQDVSVVVSSGPGVNSVSPASGLIFGGTSVTITGVNFTGATAVKFGTQDATSFTVNSPTQITAFAPAAARGVVDITVTTPLDTSPTWAADRYAYKVPVPTVSSVTPPNGYTGGGNSVVIAGTNFTWATDVLFGGTSAGSFTINSATQITVTAPAHSAGLVNVTVVCADGTSNAAGYTYITPAPTVTGVSPIAGPIAGGNTVVITGLNLTGATAVKFGTTNATSITVNSSTQITVTAPGHTAGTVDVTVTTPGGTSGTSSADYYRYAAVPTVSSASPASGSKTGNQLVTITGTNLLGATSVTFGGVPGNGITVLSDTKITIYTPIHAIGKVDVSVTTPGGVGTKTNCYQYTN